MGRAEVAQSVEHSTENAGVTGSIPVLGTNLRSPALASELRLASLAKAHSLPRQPEDDEVAAHRLLVRDRFDGGEGFLWNEAP